MGTTEQLARWAIEASYEDIPPEAYAQAKKSILDYLGTTLLGSTGPLGAIVIDYTREQGGSLQARVIGTDIVTTSVNAAFANGAMGHADDFDDLGGVGAHPAVVLTPPVLALGEELGRSGRDILEAWAIGYEVGTRLSSNLHPDRDWHPTAIFGTMAAAVASSKLLGLDVYQTRMALGIAGSEAAGLRRNFGTMTKPFHPGNASRSGVVAAQLAARGFTSDPDIIEGRQGYADNFGGPHCDLPGVTQMLGHVFYLSSQGTRIKPWPCCGNIHQQLTGLLELVEREELQPGDVTLVEEISPRVPYSGAVWRDQVHEGLEGKFCMEYVLAAAILDRKVDTSTFTDDRALQLDIREFMGKIRRLQDGESARRDSRIGIQQGSARIRVHMKDGLVHEVQLSAAHHLTGEAVVEKFHANAEKVLSHSQISETVQMSQNLEQLGNVRELLNAVTTG